MSEDRAREVAVTQDDLDLEQWFLRRMDGSAAWEGFVARLLARHASEREAIGRAAGREEAAKVASEYPASGGYRQIGRNIAAAIRALPVDGGKDGVA